MSCGFSLCLYSLQYVEDPAHFPGLNPISLLEQTMCGLSHLHSLNIGTHIDTQCTHKHPSASTNDACKFFLPETDGISGLLNLDSLKKISSLISHSPLPLSSSLYIISSYSPP